MPPMSGIFGNVSDLPYFISERISHLPFSDLYHTTLNINRHLREISHHYSVSTTLVFSLAADPLGAERRSQDDFHSGQPPPATMSSSAGPSTAPSAEYAEVNPYRLDPLFYAIDRSSFCSTGLLFSFFL